MSLLISMLLLAPTLAHAGPSLVSGGSRTCLLDGSGASCWGSNRLSALLVKDGAAKCGSERRPESCVRTPTPLAVGAPITSVAMGLSTVCALHEDGTASCWGRGDRGQLARPGAQLDTCTLDQGQGRDCKLDLNTGDIACVDTDERKVSSVPCARTPVPVAGLTGVTELVAVEGAFCAKTSGWMCWGVDAPQVLPGSVPDADGWDRFTPTPTRLPVEDAVRQVGWGFRRLVLGDGRLMRFDGAKLVPDNDLKDVQAVAGTRYWRCAVVGSERSVRCWGTGGSGQFGAGDLPADEYGVIRTGPIEVKGLSKVAKLSVDELSDHACALLDDGALWCWGENGRGQLGVGDTTDRSSPVQVPGLPPLADVAVGSQHTCALARDGGVWCWGADHLGQVGASDGSCKLDYVFDPSMVPCQRSPHRRAGP